MRNRKNYDNQHYDGIGTQSAGSVIEKKFSFLALHSGWLWYRAAASVRFLNRVVLMQGRWIMVVQGSRLHGTRVNALSTQLAFRWGTTELRIHHYRKTCRVHRMCHRLFGHECIQFVVAFLFVIQAVL
jgi:hypothetical protein